MNSEMKITMEVQQAHPPVFTSFTESQEIIKRLFTPNSKSDLKLPFNISFMFGDNQTELTSKELIDLVIDNRFTTLFSKPAGSKDSKKILMKDVLDIDPNAFVNLLR